PTISGNCSGVGGTCMLGGCRLGTYSVGHADCSIGSACCVSTAFLTATPTPETRYTCNPATGICSPTTGSGYNTLALCTSNCVRATSTPRPGTTATKVPVSPNPTSPPVTPVPPITGAPPPPPPPPTNPPQPPGPSCNYSSLQAQVQIDSTVDWTSQLVLKAGDSINLGCMHDGTGQLAENVKITAGYSDGTNYEFETNLESQWTVPKEGNYTVWCQSVDTDCAGLVSTTNATLSVGGMCKECPNDFACYGHPQYGYAWFATGYEMDGYSVSVDLYCQEDVGDRPNWLGKGRGDADCNGKIDGRDYSVWRREYVDISEGEAVVRDSWEADFAGPMGECDGIVDGYDYSLWRRSYIDVFGGDN
ncbi:hypothetical protein KKC08_06025, partial [Patescibacteria group bacterium]|nr:hypothetical protein [Patescibacteria group bacterium]